MSTTGGAILYMAMPLIIPALVGGLIAGELGIRRVTGAVIGVATAVVALVLIAI